MFTAVKAVKGKPFDPFGELPGTMPGELVEGCSILFLRRTTDYGQLTKSAQALALFLVPSA
jgi:hypothetical protein